MNLFERVINSVATLGMQLSRTHWFTIKDQEIVNEVLGEQFSLENVLSELSLLLVNSHHSIQGPRPMLPGFVEVGGLHISVEKPLDKVNTWIFMYYVH